MFALGRAIVIQARDNRTQAMSNWHTIDYINSADTNDLVYFHYDEIGDRPFFGPVPPHGALLVPPHVTGAFESVDTLADHPYTLPHVQFRLAPKDDA